MERVEVVLPPRRVDRDALAAVEVHPRDHHVKLVAALVPVMHPQGVHLVRLEAREREALEALGDRLELGFAQLLRVVLAEAENRVVVLVLVRAGLDQRVGELGISPQHRGVDVALFLGQVLHDAGGLARTRELDHRHRQATSGVDDSAASLPSSARSRRSAERSAEMLRKACSTVSASTERL